MSRFANRVRETTQTAGTGTLSLDGAVSGYRTFVAGVGDGKPVLYSIRHRTAAEWEVGLGVVTDAATDTLSRVLILDSSNSGSAVNFSAGYKDVFISWNQFHARNVHQIPRRVTCATTANITLSGEQAIDGVLTSASRVLVKSQSTASQNGIYTTGAGAWTRVVDLYTGDEAAGILVTVEQGTLNADTLWLCTTNSGSDVVGTNNLAFSRRDAGSMLGAAAGILCSDGAGTVNPRTLTAPAAGITVSNGTGAAGDPTIALANDLSALEGLASTGLAARTGTDTWAVRTLVAPAAGITVSNGDGVSGNPTLALANDLAALEALSGTSTIYYRSGVSTWSAVTIGTNLSFSGGTLDVGTGVALLGGQSGGQQLYGGTAANDDLKLDGTAHATRATSFVSICSAGGACAIGQATAETTSSTLSPRLDILATGTQTVAMILRDSTNAVKFGVYLDSVNNLASFTTLSNHPLGMASNNNAAGCFVDALNFGIGGTSGGTFTFGASAAGALGMRNATAPTTSPANIIQAWAKATATNKSNLYVRNEEGKVEQLTGTRCVVGTQFDKTSDTTLANVTNLSRDVEAGKKYKFRAVLFTSSNVASGVKAAIAGTATATAIVYEALVWNAAALAAQTRATALATAVGGVTAVTAALVIIEGTITVNAAGTLTVQFAQNASGGTASSVLVGSTLEVTPTGD